ncbi:MAG: hypothetical protein M1823_000093 [Watsoniomyces obsoletus]|nr:MAG: hypothetical protein M1823_000093 [Watsoniomyces obsoletus]
MVRLAQPLVVLTFLWPSVLGLVELKADSGEIVTVANEDDILPLVKQQELGPSKRSISPRELFSRQRCSAPGQRILCGSGCCPNDQACCENQGCIDLSRRICCPNNRSCPVGGECCRGGGCVRGSVVDIVIWVLMMFAANMTHRRQCNDGTQCVRNLRTGRRGCRRLGGGGSDNDDDDDGPSSITRSTTSRTLIFTSTTTTSTSGSSSVTATITRTSTTPTLTGSPRSRSCSRDGWQPCSNDRYCCPSGAYCYFDRGGVARCHRELFFTGRYYYSWSVSATVRWYATSTVYYLGGSGSMPSVTPPAPPTTAPADLQATVPAAIALRSQIALPTGTNNGTEDGGVDETAVASSGAVVGGGDSTATPTSSPSSSSFQPTGPSSTPPVQVGGGSSIQPLWTAILPALGIPMVMMLFLAWL